MKTALKSRKTLTAIKKLSAATTLVAISASTVAISKVEAAIIQIDSLVEPLQGPGFITFDEVVYSGSIIGLNTPANNYDNVFFAREWVIDPNFGLSLINPDPTIGVTFAERFVGQTLTYLPPIPPREGPFDDLSGTPTNPLALQVGLPLQNISVLGDVGDYNRVLSGLGPLGFWNLDAIGKGAIAILFPLDQTEFGFDLLGTDTDLGGSTTLNFFRRDGSLIDAITLDGSNPFLVGDGNYAFQATAGDEIAGVSITNYDWGGIVIDNIIYNNPGSAPPLPGTTPDNPLLPTPDPNNPNGFTFPNVTVGNNGFGTTRRIFFDPIVAVGYDYSVTGGPLFSSVLIPNALPQGDSNFTLELPGFSNQNLVAGTTFDLLSLNSSGFDKFRISGIDPAEMLDPTNPLAFVTGLTFTNPGTVTVTQNPIVQNTDNVSVPEPSNLLGLGLLGFGAFFKGQFNKKKQAKKDVED